MATVAAMLLSAIAQEIQTPPESPEQATSYLLWACAGFVVVLAGLVVQRGFKAARKVRP